MNRRPVGLTAPYRERGYKENKEWVGLTDEEIHKITRDNERLGEFRVLGFARDLEALIKEKNS